MPLEWLQSLCFGLRENAFLAVARRRTVFCALSVARRRTVCWVLSVTRRRTVFWAISVARRRTVFWALSVALRRTVFWTAVGLACELHGLPIVALGSHQDDVDAGQACSGMCSNDVEDGRGGGDR